MELLAEDSLCTVIRDKLDEIGLNQVELADEIEVDPGTISRSLNDNSTTDYSRYVEILDVIREHEATIQRPAESIMVEDILWASIGETRADVSDKFTENDFSQLPVKDNGDAIGFVTDFDLMENPDPETPVEDLVGKSAISVEPTDSGKLVKTILEEGYPAVLVRDNSEFEGIITKFDLL